jgi:hypothetical protein
LATAAEPEPKEADPGTVADAPVVAEAVAAALAAATAAADDTDDGVPAATVRRDSDEPERDSLLSKSDERLPSSRYVAYASSNLQFFRLSSTSCREYPMPTSISNDQTKGDDIETCRKHLPQNLT